MGGLVLGLAGGVYGGVKGYEMSEDVVVNEPEALKAKVQEYKGQARDQRAKLMSLQSDSESVTKAFHACATTLEACTAEKEKPAEAAPAVRQQFGF